ncbi:MlaD family protein [Nocardioides ultimimeridianus]
MSRKMLMLCVAIVALLVSGFALVGRTPDSDGTLTAYFQDASPLERGSEVRIDGVKVGKVDSIDLDGKVAKVAMTVQKQVLPLHQGARLEIKPINVLGENYVSIVDGKPTAPYDASAEIPVDRTSSVVNLQDVLNTFDDPTSTGLAALVAALGDGVAGNGTKAAQAIRALAPTMSDLTGLGRIIRQQNGVLSSLIDKAAPVSAALTRNNGRDLDVLIANAKATLSALGDNQTAIEQTIKQLPTTLIEARRTLDDLGKVSDSIAPTLRDARPVTSHLSTISDEITNFSTYAAPAFRNFATLLVHADGLIKAARPIAADLRKHGTNLRNTAHRTVPVGNQLLDVHLQDLMDFVTKWALSTNSRDAISHYFRGVVFVTPQALNTLAGNKVLPGGLSQPSLGGVTGGLTNGLQGTVQGLTGALGGTKGNPLTGLLGSLLGGNKRTSSRSATGLSSTQEHALLDQLIGGQ